MKVNRTYRNHRMLTLAGAIAVTLCSGASASPPNSALSLWRSTPGVGAAVVTEGSSGKNIALNMQHGALARYTVILKEEPVATYDGRTSGFEKVPLAKGRLNMKSAEAAKYVSYLQARQSQFLSDAGAQLKRPLGAIMQFQHAVNGVVVELTSAEAAEIAARDDVLLVDIEKMLPLMTDRSPIFIGADKIWDGSATGGFATQGEGIVIGDIDTGINYTSPSFAAVGPLDGYQHINPLGAGNYLGLCQPGGFDAGNCNDKLIGLYNFVYSVCSGSGNPCGAPGTWQVGQGALDYNGHGSHTSSTAGGNHASIDYSGGNFTIQGVAPHASLIEYTVCYTVVSTGQGSCPSTSTTAAANQAVADGIVDVLTFSIGGGTSPWTDSTSMAFLGAQNAGIFVVAAAGNDGPAASTVSHVEPWVATAAASTDDQVFGYTFSLNGPGTPPSNTVGLPVRPGANPQPTGDLVNLPITQSPGFANGNNDGCAAFASAHTFDRDLSADRIFADGFETTPTPPPYEKGIAVLHLDASNSGCGSVTRRANALNAGAAGVIFVDNAYINLGASGTSYSMIFSDWNNVYAQIVGDPANARASVLLPLKAYFTAQGDVIANFSSRGPAAGIGGQAIVKPEIAAPGVGILAAYMGDPGAAAVEDGTSMATPHIAGSAALLRALHPTWSPTQIRSAMMMTAKTAGVVNQDQTPAGIWDTGSGRIDLPSAAKASLLFDETGANFLAANPATGGKISTLNLPSIADSNCVGPCTYTRTVRGVHAGALTYTLSIDGFPAGAASVAPASLPVSTGGTKTFTVTVRGDMLTSGQYTLGQVTFTPSDPSVPVQHMPVAVKPGGPAIQVAPSAVSASAAFGGSAVTQSLAVTNIGNPTLNWTIGTGNAPITVMNTATTNNGELGGYYSKIPASSYLAQNFDVSVPTQITKLTANGFRLPSGSLTTANTPAITFKVYADASGVPAGTVGDPPTVNIGTPPLFDYTNSISTANGISATNGVINLDLTKAGVPVLNLAPGRYWLVVAPNITSDASNSASNPLWAWRVSSDPVIGNSAQIIGSLWGITAWEDVEATPTMLSSIVAGTVACTQPSWVSYAPTSGALGYNGVSNVVVTFDPTGLFAGNYTGSLCITSNATNLPTVITGLGFTVTGTPPVPPSLSAGFSPGSIVTGGSSSLTLTLSNSNSLPAILSANLIDAMPSGLVASNAATTCTGGAGASLGGSGSSLILGNGAAIPAGGSCTLTADVTSSAAGSYTNTIPAGALQTNAGNAAAASASLTVTGISAPTVSKAFAPTSINTGAASTLTITLSNNNPAAATLSSDLTDTFPSGMVLTASPAAATTCTGGSGVSTTSGSITLGQNATIPANGSCTVSVNVTSASAGSYANQIGVGALATNFGSNTAAANDTLTVAAPDPYRLYSNLGTDAGSDLLNGSTTVLGSNRYTPMVCSRFTLAQPGQQLITSFTWTSTNHNATAFATAPTTSIAFYDDSGASGGPGVRLGNTNDVYYGGGNFGTTINPGVNNTFTANPLGYTATYVPAPASVKANVWACLYYYGASATFTDAQLSNLGQEKYVNAPTAGSTSDLVFVSTGGPNGSTTWVDNPPGNLTSGGGNVFGWELTTLGTNIMLDTYQMKNSSGTAATGTIALNSATGVARNFSGYAATITAPAGGNKWSVTGLQLTPLCNAAKTFTAVQAKIQFWDTFAGSAGAPVFSNSTPIAAVTANLDVVTTAGCAGNTSYFILPVRLATPVTVGAGATLGVTIEYLTDTGSGLGANADLVSLTNSASSGYAPAVGANASTGATGWYKSTSNDSTLNFTGSTDYVTGTRVHIPVRVYGNQVTATGIAAQTPREVSAQGPQQQAEVESPMQNGPLSLEKQ
ncbi:MAG: S8 family serine peptidase [Proteobacteria bacterium]|nr:S8 family serine peptidase [Pseudomonadota bacterium]